MTRGWRRIALILGLTLLVAGCGASPEAPSSGTAAAVAPSQSGSAGSSSPEASGRHVYLLILENKAFDQIIGAAKAPYLSSLAKQYATATNYSAVAHPSQPNYLALFSGSTQGVTDDKPHDLNAETIAHQIAKAGMAWRVYAENVPSGCFTGASATGGSDGAGTYTRKHEPAISFRGIASDPTACANIRPLSQFDPSAANFSLIVPNMCHDMHDCSIAQGDTWLATFLPRIITTAAFRANGVLFITFDEGHGRSDANGVATIVASAAGPHGVTSDRRYDHYSLLRTVQQLLALPCLANSCDAQPMSDLVSP